MKAPLGQSNYDKMRDWGETAFARCDQEAVIRKFALPCDRDFVYVTFLGRRYRISRSTGRVEWESPHTRQYHHGDYNEVMTILDVLCCSREDCALAGEFVPITSLSGVVQSSPLGKGLFSGYASFFEHRLPLLEQACRSLGGRKEALPGDLAFRLDLLEFLPVVVQYWDGDDEFPPELRLLWDRNILTFMHYETTYFAAGHLFQRLREAAEEENGAANAGADRTRRI